MKDAPYCYFRKPASVAQRHYEALRAFFFEKQSAEEVAARFGYTVSALYSLARDFRHVLKKGAFEDLFFTARKPGRKKKDPGGDLTGLIVGLRKKNLSVPAIKAMVDAQGHTASEKYIYQVLKKEGFDRLPRRGSLDKKSTHIRDVLTAPESSTLNYDPE